MFLRSEWGGRAIAPNRPIVREIGTIEPGFKGPYLEILMRPLFHPSIEDVRLDAILHALSDPVRAQIFSEITAADFSQPCSAFLKVRDRSIPKSSLSQHFKVLREAGLLRAERHGVEVRNTSRFCEIQERFPGLLPAIISAHAVEADRDG